jgi:hypothetical protein
MKKVLSLLLVLTLVLGMSVTSFAVGDPGDGTGFSVTTTATGSVVAAGEHDFEDVYTPSPTFNFFLATSAFDLGSIDEAKKADREASAAYHAGLATAGLTKAALPKVVSRIRVAKGSNVIKTAELKFAKLNDSPVAVAKIEVEFVTPFANNNPDGQAFDFWVYPVVGGKIKDYESMGMHFIGTLKNHTIEIDSSYDYVDLYTGIIADIKETIRQVEYSLGPDTGSNNNDDVVLVGRAVKNQRYWGRAHTDLSDTDIDYMDQYGIEQVYHLVTLGGLDKVTDHVVLNTAAATDYVFDGDLQFLGMGNSSTIPFRNTYYIAPEMIEVATDEPIEGDEDIDPLVVPPETGGDISAPAGIFDNPSTGA